VTIGSTATTSYTNTGLANGTTYYYVVTQVNPVAESTNSVQVSATPLCTPPPTPTANNNGPICAGSTLTLTASTVPGATYSWTGPNGFTSSAQNPSVPNATVGASGSYSVTAAANGCTSLAGITITVVNAIPAAPTAGNNGPLCTGSTLNLTASTVPGATYSWTGPNGFTSSAQNPSIPSATISASGSYSVTAAINGCTSLAGTTIALVSAIPNAPTAGNNGPLCAGSTLNLTASTVPGATYSWTGPNGFTSTNQNPVIASASAAASGLYSVTATANACPSVAGTTTVTINPVGVSIQLLGGDMILSWPDGTLQSATNVSGPWDDINGATCPWTNPAAAPQEFYRLRLP
jgi:hypothetical protein